MSFTPWVLARFCSVCFVVTFISLWVFVLHYDLVTWASWHVKSPAIALVVNCLFSWESTGHKWPVTWESFPCHDVIVYPFSHFNQGWLSHTWIFMSLPQWRKFKKAKARTYRYLLRLKVGKYRAMRIYLYIIRAWSYLTGIFHCTGQKRPNHQAYRLMCSYTLISTELAIYFQYVIIYHWLLYCFCSEQFVFVYTNPPHWLI